MLIDYKINPKSYAQAYSKLTISGTQFLAFRDLSVIITQHVNGDTALDYGCGVGKSSMFLKSIGLNVESVDINSEMIKLAQYNDVTGKYSQIKSGEINSEDESFDLVFASWVLMEISSKNELSKVVNEISRVLKVGGTFITIVCNENTYNTDWLSENTEFKENTSLNSGSIVKMFFKDIDLAIYDYFWTEQDYKNTLKHSNLESLKIHNPLGRSDDGYDWINEKTKSPCSIFIAKK